MKVKVFDKITGATTNAAHYFATELKDGVLALLSDKNSTPYKFGGKLEKLFATTGISASTAGVPKLSVADVDAALAGRNLPISDRIELKSTLHRAGLL
jgi:hypothetical protein